ncbi:MAG: hypothetical protein EBX41_04785, partial [Chitinophagia bacterium]|nr:hypothetical protein [Chitinophagia bacterium]
ELTTAQISVLSLSQVASISGLQSQNLLSKQVVALTTGQFLALGSAALVGLQTDNIVALTTSQAAALVTNSVRALTSTQIFALQTQDIASLGNPKYLWGILAILLATCSWALGSVINKKKGKAENPTFNAGLQLFFGGALMLLISPVADDYSHIDYFNTEGLLSLLYLIVFGSLLGYTAYMYVLRVLPVGVATIYAYINPLVAVLLGVAVMHETVNIYTLFAFVTIIAGVYMVNKGNNMPAKQSPETTEDKMVSTS